MPQRPFDPRGVPRWLVVVGSAVLAAHLFVVVCNVLAAPSGPWPMIDLVRPPQFADSVSQPTLPYLRAVKMTHNYHFSSNRPARHGVYLEARLKDAAGQELKTLRIPEEGANAWVRHRQALLVSDLTRDMPLMPPVSEAIAPPQQQAPTVPIWDLVEPQFLRLRVIPEHLIPRDRPVERPSDWSLLLARSYARYLCRTHGAASVELIRHTRDPIPYDVLFTDRIPAGVFAELIANFGEFPR